MDPLIQATINRYTDASDTKSMGCANLTPFLKIAAGECILDLGCGKGHQTQMLAGLTGKSGRVYGLDITPAMTARAKEENSADNIEFITGDIHQIPLENESIDLVVSNCVINHSLNKKQVYQEILRVLKPSGRFIIADVMSVEKLPDHVRDDPQTVADCYGGAVPKAEYFSLIKACGLIHIKELTSRSYLKNGFLLESIILTGEKP